MEEKKKKEFATICFPLSLLWRFFPFLYFEFFSTRSGILCFLKEMSEERRKKRIRREKQRRENLPLVIIWYSVSQSTCTHFAAFFSPYNEGANKNVSLILFFFFFVSFPSIHCFSAWNFYIFQFCLRSFQSTCFNNGGVECGLGRIRGCEFLFDFNLKLFFLKNLWIYMFL